MSNWKYWVSVNGLILSFTALVLVALGFFWTSEYEKWLLAERRGGLEETLTIFQSSLERTLNNRFSLLNGLEKFVTSRTDHEIQRDFSVFAQGLHNDFAGVRNVGIAPKGVLTLIYPTVGNEEALGYRILEDTTPNVQADIRKTLESREVVVSDPFELRQGGLGLAGRKAIFKEGKLWGLISVVVDVPMVVKGAGLEGRAEVLGLALRDKRGVFWGAPEIFKQNPIILKIETGRGNYWELGGVPRLGWSGDSAGSLTRFKLLYVVIAGLVLVLISQLLKKDVRLVMSEGSFSDRLKNLKIVFIYSALSVLWIFYSDRALLSLFADPKVISEIKTVKGLVFVLISSMVIYWMIEINYGKYIVTSKALRSVMDSSRALISATNSGELCQGICDALVTKGNYSMVWIGLITNKRSENELSPLGVAGKANGFFGEEKMTQIKSLGESSPCSEAISSGKMVVVKDVTKVLSYPEWRLASDKMGYSSSMTIPLLNGSKSIGVMEIYSSRIDSFSNGDAEVLNGLAKNLTIRLLSMKNGSK